MIGGLIAGPQHISNDLAVRLERRWLLYGRRKPGRVSYITTPVKQIREPSSIRHLIGVAVHTALPCCSAALILHFMPHFPLLYTHITIPAPNTLKPAAISVSPFTNSNPSRQTYGGSKISLQLLCRNATPACAYVLAICDPRFRYRERTAKKATEVTTLLFSALVISLYTVCA